MDRVLYSSVANPALQAACTKLQGHIVPGGMLDGVAEILRGSRYTGFTVFPLITVARGPSPSTGQTFATVEWQLPIRLTAFVQSTEDLADAEDLSVDYASRAFMALMTSPDTGEMDQSLPGVGVLKAGNFEPPSVHPTEPHIFIARVTALATVTSTF